MFSVTILEKSVNLVSAFFEKINILEKDLSIKPDVYLKPTALALMGNGISRFRKQDFLVVVFVYREYSGQQELAPPF